MARRYGGVQTITPVGRVFTGEEVRATLAQRPAKVVAIVHGETSTGAEQPLADIVGGSRAWRDLIVDTVACWAASH